VLSLALHGVVLTLAAYVTAHATMARPTERVDVVRLPSLVPSVPGTPAAPSRIPSRGPSRAPSRAPRAPSSPAPVPSLPVERSLSASIDLPDRLPPVTLPGAPSPFGDRPDRGAAGTSASGDDRTSGREPAGPYAGDAVDRQASVIAGSPHPEYPEGLRAAGISGRVDAQFVVDTSGRVERGSFTVIASDGDQFADAVRRALPAMRFHPAEAGGRRVRQLVRQVFAFTLTP
jgi:protein TonB